MNILTVKAIFLLVFLHLGGRQSSLLVNLSTHYKLSTKNIVLQFKGTGQNNFLCIFRYSNYITLRIRLYVFWNAEKNVHFLSISPSNLPLQPPPPYPEVAGALLPGFLIAVLHFWGLLHRSKKETFTCVCLNLQKTWKKLYKVPSAIS